MQGAIALFCGLTEYPVFVIVVLMKLIVLGPLGLGNVGLSNKDRFRLSGVDEGQM